MKKTLFLSILMAFISIAGYSQFTMGLGAGYSLNHSVPTAEFSFGGILRESLVVELAGQTILSRKVETGTQFQWKMGIQVNRYGSVIFTPFSGMSYHYRSADRKSLNEVAPLFGLEAAMPFRYEPGRVYVSGSYSDKNYIVSLGVKYLFQNRAKCR